MGKRKKKRRALPPRVKRMKRPGRLASAQSWLQAYNGKNILRGYCKHFAVDWRCAAIELKMLGVELDPEYLANREKLEAEKILARKRKTEAKQACSDEHWHPYTEPFEAYLAGDFAALYDLEQRRDAEERDQWSLRPTI